MRQNRTNLLSNFTSQQTQIDILNEFPEQLLKTETAPLIPGYYKKMNG